MLAAASFQQPQSLRSTPNKCKRISQQQHTRKLLDGYNQRKRQHAGETFFVLRQFSVPLRHSFCLEDFFVYLETFRNVTRHTLFIASDIF